MISDQQEATYVDVEKHTKCNCSWPNNHLFKTKVWKNLTGDLIDKVESQTSVLFESSLLCTSTAAETGIGGRDTFRIGDLNRTDLVPVVLRFHVGRRIFCNFGIGVAPTAIFGGGGSGGDGVTSSPVGCICLVGESSADSTWTSVIGSIGVDMDLRGSKWSQIDIRRRIELWRLGGGGGLLVTDLISSTTAWSSM